VWQVMTEPSVDASFPTMMLVHPNSASLQSLCCSFSCVPVENSQSEANKNRTVEKKIKPLVFCAFPKIDIEDSFYF
jgi:hypothetical protein